VCGASQLGRTSLASAAALTGSGVVRWRCSRRPSSRHRRPRRGGGGCRGLRGLSANAPPVAMPTLSTATSTGRPRSSTNRQNASTPSYVLASAWWLQASTPNPAAARRSGGPGRWSRRSPRHGRACPFASLRQRRCSAHSDRELAARRRLAYARDATAPRRLALVVVHLDSLDVTGLALRDAHILGEPGLRSPEPRSSRSDGSSRS
jgi:hypothetical protein